MNSHKVRTNPPMLKTKLVPYLFDTQKPAEREAWEALKAKLEAEGYRCMESLSMQGQNSHGETGRKLAGEISLETAHLFDTQWNSTTHRVFDWALDAKVSYSGPRYHMAGYYLEMTDEMRAIRAEVTKCGYCGAYGTVTDGPDFCTECYTSEYLKESDLKLTRMRPIDKTGYGPGSEFLELTDEERARLTLTYKESQGIGNTQRAIERRALLGKKAAKRLVERLEKAEKDKIDAQTEHDAILWLLDRGVRNESVSNLIYYTHTKVFTFGWMDYQALNDEAVAELKEVLKDFPHKWEIVRGKKSLAKGEACETI